MMARPLSTTFKSVKPHNVNLNLNINKTPSKLPLKISSSSSSSKQQSSWSVYLILSTNPPIKTYVGVTTNFTRRLKEHNGELQGGAKASRSGRPWVCACLIQGFPNRSQACVFESKWKSVSRKSKRKTKSSEVNVSLPLLQHREAALDRVKELIDCSHLNIKWHLDT